MADPEKYPEHSKLKEIQYLSQAIYDFLSWCDECHIILAEEGRTISGRPTDEFLPVLKSRESLLAEHFNIDLKKLEQEKRDMLDSFRDKEKYL